MEDKVGIITYHSAYNFGSVLQAYATQEKIRQLGYQPQIINYRMKVQLDYYSLYRKCKGVKTYVKDLLLYPFARQRKLRAQKFEDFIDSLELSEVVAEPDEFDAFAERYDIFLSGSDQIWNKKSNELSLVDWKYMNPYLLTFTARKKVSYASSVASMTDEELMRIKPMMEKFDHLSFREQISADKISLLLGREIPAVLDPTLLMTKNEWEHVLDKKGYSPALTGAKPYILFYSLDGYKDVKAYLASLRDLAMEKGIVIYAITPFLSFKDDDICKFIYDAGPIDFISLIKNAECVVTDSYHGTLFSINFEKKFYSITNGTASHMRKNQILDALQLENRITKDCVGLNISDEIDYKPVHNILEKLRTSSYTYLRNALKN